MMIWWLRRAESSVTRASGTTVYMSCCTLCSLQVCNWHVQSRMSGALIRFAGHGLRELDIELMRRLSPRVNVIPVIGKADSLTPLELAESKKLIMEDIEHYRIPVYNFPYDIEEDDEDTVEENAELRGLMPFAIVGSEDIVEVDGRRVRAR